MGKVNDSILAGTSGRTGRVVIVKLNGLEYSRIRPKKHSKAPTQKQLLIQQRIKFASDFMSAYRVFACKYFGHRIGSKSRFNLAMTSVIDSIEMDFDLDQLTIHYPQIAFSRGILPPFVLKEFQKISTDEVKLEWYINGNSGNENDLLQLVVAIDGQPESYFFEDVASRNQGTFTFNIPLSLQEKTLHFYGTFKAANEEIASNSTYIGKLE